MDCGAFWWVLGGIFLGVCLGLTDWRSGKLTSYLGDPNIWNMGMGLTVV